MQFSTLLLTAFASLAAAQNPFTFNKTPEVSVGTPFNITWAPSTGTSSTVSLILRQGESTALTTVLTIASGIQNTGSYLWTPTEEIVNGEDYAFEIVDDGNVNIYNYSGQFAISSPNTVSSSPSSSSPTSASSDSSSPSSTDSSAASSTDSAATTSGSKASSTGSSKPTTAGSKTSTSAVTPTGTSTVPSLGAAAVGMKVWGAGGLLGLVGAVMVAL